MKHKIFKTLLAAVLATMTFCAEADTEIVDGIEWQYTVANGEATVRNPDNMFSSAIPESTSGAITIPSRLGGYPVTSIGYEAFYDCSSLTSVTIPNSVTSIGDGAFRGCSSLTSVTIPNSVTSIRSSAFSGCSSLKSVTIPNSVMNIGESAFSGCSSLTSVTIPNSVTNIGKWAFEGCGELTFYTDNGNRNPLLRNRLRWMLENAGANVKEIIVQKAKEQEAEEEESRGIRWWLVLGCVGTIVILGGLFFWIVRRKKKNEGAIDKADCSVEVANVSDTVEELNENVCPSKGKWWSPSGRATRSMWWLSRLVVVFSFNLGFKALSAIRESYFENMLFIFSSIIIICITVYMCIIVDIKRLHDRNMSGKWILLDYFAKFSGVLVLQGVVGIAFLIILGFLDGTRGPNRYGEDPKDRV